MAQKRESFSVISRRRKNVKEVKSLAQKAYQMIREEILRGELRVGDNFSRRQLAKKFNMSFLPITEALKQLESEGLVESRPRAGTRVRIPTKQEILDGYVVREALESQAARLCCERMTASEREQITQSAKELDALYKAIPEHVNDSRFLFAVHFQHMVFHLRIAELSHSPGLLNAIEKQQVLIFNWIYDTAVDLISPPSNFHYDLAKAICSGDVLKADDCMRSHIRYRLDEEVKGLGTLKDASAWRAKRAVRCNSLVSGCP
jgi:DNA-binding GntR family transcriptional regulator